MALGSYACIHETAFVCDSSAQCIEEGAQGTCEVNGFCAFPDDSCESGRRFGGAADDELAGECVDPATVQPDCSDTLTLAAGNDHTCALDGGAVWCWGRNDLGQLGDGTFVDRSEPVRVVGIDAAVQLSAGHDHTCAMDATGVVWCWGDNEDAKLGFAGPVALALPVVATTNAKDVAAGGNHSCAVLFDGRVECWGDNGSGQLGYGEAGGYSSPVLVAGLDDIVDVDTGWNHSCALDAAGSVWCWGSDALGQIGDDDDPVEDDLLPLEIGLSNIVEISLGGDHSCARTDSGELSCWGTNGHGQVGNGDFNTQPVPDLLASFAADSISAGGTHTCARSVTDQRIYCWGDNGLGQLGDPVELEDKATPVPVVGLQGEALDFAAGDGHTCAFIADGSIVCWGKNSMGQLGLGSTLRSATPLGVDGLAGAAVLAASPYHTCAVDSSGAATCWGDGADGELGHGEEVPSSGPVSVGSLAGADAIYAGHGRSCAHIANDVVCWGDHYWGLLGNGSTSTQLMPTPLGDAVGEPVSVALGVNHTCAVNAAGEVYCWGTSSYGALGSASGSTQTAQLATAAPAGSLQAAVGSYHTCVRTVSEVTCWGHNSYGQLGDGTTDAPGSGIAVTAVLPAVEPLAVVAGDYHSCALLTGGAVYCWGANSDGQVGDPDGDSSISTPVEVDLPATTVALGASGRVTCAALSDGRVFCWGSNSHHQLALAEDIDESATPVEIAGVSAITLAVGGEHVCAASSAGDVICWGNNTEGQLGDGRTVATADVLESALSCGVGE